MKLAFYLRLSMSDGDLGKDNKDESNSIENQRALLQEYVEAIPELSLYEQTEYIDDGYTGTNFERPGFKQLIEDAQSGKIQVILVKDLSRLGRDYIGVGDYIEQIFPVLNVRFIAVNNHYDSDDYLGKTMGLDMAVSNLVNHMYSRDISKKIRSALEVKWKQGYATSCNVPFGYLIDKNQKGKWEIDPVASKYVRLVFELAVKGYSTTAITRHLNEMKIPTPGQYNKMNQIGTGAINYVLPEEERLWEPGIVWRVLTNYAYTGALVMGKRKVMNMGVKIVRVKAKEDWTITENAHDPIVSVEEYELAQQAIRNKKKAEYSVKYEHPLKGKIRCGTCKRILTYEDNRREVFYCHHGRGVGKHSNCFKEAFSVKMIESRVRYAVTQMVQIVRFIQNEIEKTADSTGVQNDLIDVSALEREIEVLKAERIRQYEAYADGVITREFYSNKKNEITEKIAALQAEIDRAEELKNPANTLEGQIDELSALASEYEKEPKLTREIVDAFIEEVFLFNGSDIEIRFKFEDVIKTALEKYAA